MSNRPHRTYLVLVPAAVAAFAISGVGHDSTSGNGGLRYWVGAIGWATFGLLLVATAVYSIALGARSFLRRRA